jgi:arginine decarboxylase
MNYTLQEYANDVVYHIQTVCDEVGVKHPTIVSESGRAISAYHSMLIFNVLGTLDFGEEKIPLEVKEEFEQPLVDLIEAYHGVTQRNALETYHDAQQALDMAMNLFSGGYLTLEQRSHARNLYFAICEKIYKLCQGHGRRAGGSAGARRAPVGHVFLQLLAVPVDPDSWAIKQLFPVMPIHRLNERPVNHAVLSDITCDSTASSISSSIGRDVKKTIMLHKFNGRAVITSACSWSAPTRKSSATCKPVWRTHAVHISLGENGIDHTKARASSTSSRATPSAGPQEYASFDPELLWAKLRRDVESRDQRRPHSDNQAGAPLEFLRRSLMGYTYLEDPNAD